MTVPSLACAALLGVGLATTALPCAAGDESRPTARVRYDDLDLTSDAGTQALLHRLSSAARHVCDEHGVRELARLEHAEQCYREALANAVVAVHNERLSVLYNATRGVGTT
jgi:UrcA family protein